MEDVRLPRLPFEVFLCIIAVINDGRVPFEHAAYFCGPDPCDDAVNSLKALSLTHRSLTGPAQRALGSRLRALSFDQVSGLLASPLLGMCTRELTLMLTTTVRERNGYERTQRARPHAASEMVDASLKVIGRAPNLRALRVKCPLFGSKGERVETHRLLDGIGANAKTLQHLCWTGPEYADERERLSVEEVWRGLGRARRSLKILSLWNVELRSADPRDVPGKNELALDAGGDGAQQEQEDDDDDNPDSAPLNLTTLTLVKVDAKAFPTPRSSLSLTRLFGRRGTLHTLALDLTSETSSPSYTSELIRILSDSSTPSSFSSCWSALTHLRLRIGVGPIHASASGDSSTTPGHLTRFFQACTALTHLQVWVGLVRRMALDNAYAETGVSDVRNEFSKIFLPAVVASTESFVPLLLSCAVGSCTTLSSLHLGFFHIAGPLGGHRWKSLDEGVARGLSSSAGLQVAQLRLRQLLIDTHEEEFAFPCVRQTCAEMGSGCAFEVCRDANSAFF